MGCATKIDDRVDGELFRVNQDATKMIPEMFSGGRFELDAQGAPTEPAKVWMAYLAAEAYGYADATLIAVTHNRGRQARILERQVYECVKRAEYYAANPCEARLEFLAWPWRDKRMHDDLGYPRDSPRYKSIELAIKNITSKYPEVPIYAARYGNKERRFYEMVVDPQKPETARDYAFHYRRLSQTAHGSVSGMADVFDWRDDGGVWAIRFDSRVEDPNLEVLDVTIYLVHLLDILDGVLERRKWESDIQPLDTRLNGVIARLYPDRADELIRTESSADGSD